jgi:hypothetical protein
MLQATCIYEQFKRRQYDEQNRRRWKRRWESPRNQQDGAIMRCTSDQLTQLDLIHTETGVSAVALSANDLEMLARYVVGVIAQNDRQRAERKARRCGLINFRVQEYASRVFAARLNAETRKQNEPCLK